MLYAFPLPISSFIMTDSFCLFFWSDMQTNGTLPAAAIFDMDGVLIDSNPYHLRKWIDFLTAHNIPFKAEELPKLILGQRNDTALRYFFGEGLTSERSLAFSEELEEKFRDAFRPHARPPAGLEALLRSCREAKIPMAVASSAMRKNVEFAVDALGLRAYFRCLVSGDEVTHPKPHPEIYMRTAQTLGVKPENCIAFEDSFVGIESAKGAGMKCVAIASTFPIEELRTQTRADLAVPSFEKVSLKTLRELF